jgi:hypothetical protein
MSQNPFESRQLVLETSRSLLRVGESLKVLCRFVLPDGQFATESPEVRVRVSPLDHTFTEPEHASRELKLPAITPDDRALVTGRLSTEELAPGSYVVAAAVKERAGEDESEAEREIVILSRSDYDALWTELAKEEILDPRVAVYPDDVLVALRSSVTEQLGAQLRTSGIKSEIQLRDRRAGSALDPFDPTPLALLEWVHHHLIEAAYEKLFSGGTLAIALTIDEGSIQSRFVLTSPHGDIGEEDAAFLPYITLGTEVKISRERVSEHQYVMDCSIPTGGVREAITA